MKNILITGGLGYIGTNLCIGLLKEGYDVIILDNLQNSVDEKSDGAEFACTDLIGVLGEIEEMCDKSPIFIHGDVLNSDALHYAFSYDIDTVIHLAASKPSLVDPVSTVNMLNNTAIDTAIIQACITHDVKHFIYASSASVYGQTTIPSSIRSRPSPCCVYGSTKYATEVLLKNIAEREAMEISIMRYFNPLGGHLLGRLKHRPDGIMGALKTACEKGVFHVEGANACLTPDGTPIRDYIHMDDLVKFHLDIIRGIDPHHMEENFEIYNVGTGKGTSVLEFVNQYKKFFRVDFDLKPHMCGGLVIDSSISAEPVGLYATSTALKGLVNIFRDYL